MKQKTILKKLLATGLTALICNTVQATVVINKSFPTAEETIHHYLSIHHPDQNFSDEFYLLDMAGGGLEKFDVSQEYKGKLHVTFEAKELSSSERTLAQQFARELHVIWDELSRQKFDQIPAKVVPNSYELTTYQFKRNDLSDYIEKGISTKLQRLIDNTLIRMAAFANIKLEDDNIHFYAVDDARVSVRITYYRTSVEVQVTKVVDRYNNTIPLSRAELNSDAISFRVNWDDTGHFEALMRYLQGSGMTMVGILAGGSGVNKGSVRAIQCYQGTCEVVE
ncbi:hypothetical protein ACFOEE_02205 [Pseudoalteromonas fenneropenaei]|uniref:Uncharacterized protein n=1 Tax=Pseudoalteromonas fenneropenaei TaxID=1737459 RepID=A0ABV7CFF8_9GAMM